jgi:tetratricopeptide (TPR) repeat protein
MRTFLKAIVVTAALLAGFSPAHAAKAKAARGTSITELDIRICMGIAGADAAQQIPVCTKIINSGKVKHPHESEYYAYRAGAYLAVDRGSDAVTDLNKAIALVDKPEFRFQRALASMATNDLDAAITDLDRVIAVKNDFATAYFMRGVIHYRNAEFKAAVPEFDKAATLIPTYYQAIFARGASKLKSNDEEGGRADVKTARGMSGHADEDAGKIGISAP